MGDIAQVEVVAAVEQFKKDMASAGTAFRQVMKDIAAANQPAQAAAQETSNVHEGLLGKLREFRGEQVQQGRMARFYANELLSIVPAGKDAKDSLQGLLGIAVEAAAGGVSFGLAFEAVKFAIEAFTAASREAAEEAKAIGQNLSKLADDVEAAWAKVRGASATEKTGGQLDAINRLLAKREQLERAVADAKARVDAGTERPMEWYEATKALKEFDEQVRKSGHDLVKERSLDQQKFAAESLEGMQTGNDKATSLMQEAQSRFLGIEAATAGARQKIVLEGEQRIAEIRRKYQGETAAGMLAMRDNQIAAERRATANALQEYDRKLTGGAGPNAPPVGARLYRDRESSAGELSAINREEELARLTTENEAEVARYKAQQAAMAAAKQRGDKLVVQSTREAEKAIEQLTAAGERMGQTLGAAFVGLATGAKTFGQAVTEVMQQIVQIVVQAAIKQITANAMTAGSGAAASQAGIPLIGPVLAISAMGAMITAVLALIGNLTSSRGGYEVPGNVSAALGILHPNETVLPADLSMGLKDLIRGGGGVSGGGTTNNNFTIQAFDGPDVERTLLKLRDKLQRNGRW
jgi:hypothetical protein